MKKFLLAVTLFFSMLSLSACKVNWFGESYDVPWYFVAIPVLAVFVAVYITIISKTYICPGCKAEIKPKWYQLSVCLHFMGKRVVKCPKCGRKGFCERKK